MRTVRLLLGATLLLALVALLAYFFGPQFEMRGVPPDIQALYMKDTQAKWRVMGGLIGFVALLVALLAAILWLNVRKSKQ